MPSVEKELMLKEISDQFSNNDYAFISSFEKLPVAEMMDLRRTLEKVSTRTLVIKHTLAKKIFDEQKLEKASDLLGKSVMVTFAESNPQDASKALVDFSKNNDKVVPQGVIFEGQVYEQAFLKKLAQLPTRQELLTQVAVGVKSPISGLVLTLGGVMRGFVIALGALRDKKQSEPQSA